MSLVTTAISNLSRNSLQRASTRAVFPEPTGPATPRRRGCSLVIFFASSSSVSRSKEPRVERLVARAGDRLPRRRRAELVVRELERAGDDARDGAAGGGQ